MKKIKNVFIKIFKCFKKPKEVDTMHIPEVSVLSNAPCVDDDAIKNYKFLVGALESAISDRKNHNIGVIGDYGSGKSSALAVFKAHNEFKEKNKKRKIVTISLAEFCSNQFPSDRDLQFSLVQQLFHSVYRKQIPTSQFVKRGFVRKMLWMLLCFIAFGISLGLGFLFKSFPETCGYRWIPFTSSAFFGFITLTLLITVIPYGTFKARFKDLEIEFKDLSKDNLFDCFLEEIIYFFYKTKKDLIIFEDIDRSNDCERLFSKLYTLNVCLNNHPVFKKRANSVVFVHAVKETIFPEGEEKSKYFDVLLPVRPIYGKDNAIFVLNNNLKKLGYTENLFDKECLSSLQLNVHYYRQMNNLINSFNVIYSQYGRNLTTDQRTSLLCVLLYKSLFPQDYIYALKNKGVLIFIMKSKEPNFSDYLNDDNYCISELHNITDINQLFNILATDTEEIRKFKLSKIEKYRNEERKFKQILLFYSNVKKFLKEESFDLVISKNQKNLPENLQVYFSDLIFNREIDYIDYIFDNLDEVLNAKEFIENIGHDPSYNVYIYDELLKEDKYKKLLLVYEANLIRPSNIKTKFIARIYRECAENNKTLYKDFFKRLAKFYSFTNKDLLSYFEKKTNEYLMFIILNCVGDKESFIRQNENNILSLFLTNQYSLDGLVDITDENFKIMFELSPFKFDYLLHSEKLENKLMTKIDFILDHNLFVCRKENVCSIYSFLNKNGSKNDFLTTLYKRMNLFNYIMDNYINKINEFGLIVDNYSDEDPNVIFDLMAAGSHDLSRLPNFYETIPLIEIKENKAIGQNYIVSLYNSSKMSGNLDELGFVWANFKNLKMISYIKNNPYVLLKDNPKTKTGEDYLYRILNSDVSNYQLGKHVLINCLSNYILDVSLLNPNNNVLDALANFGYFKINNLILKKMSLTQFNSYLERFNHLDFVIENIVNLELSSDYLITVLSKITDITSISNVFNVKKVQILSNMVPYENYFINSDKSTLDNDIIFKFMMESNITTEYGRNIYDQCKKYLTKEQEKRYFFEQIFVKSLGTIYGKFGSELGNFISKLNSRFIYKTKSEKCKEFRLHINKKHYKDLNAK